LSLALRITAIVAVAMTAVFAAFAWQTSRSLEQHFAEQDFDELQAVAESVSHALATSAETASDDGRQALERRLAAAVMGHHGVFFAVWDADGQRVFGTAPADLSESGRSQPTAARLDVKAMRVWTEQSRSYRGAVVQMGTYRVLVAVVVDFHLRYLAQLRQTLWLATIIACAVAIVAARLAVMWGHAPIRRLSARIGEVGSGQLHLRLDTALVPVELHHLVDSFNGMLDRLQDSFVRLSDFSADIAHELRTPVTNLTTQAQVALSKTRSVEQYKELLYSSLEELDRMGKMIADMLLLAQADHRLSPPDLVSVDVGAEVRELFEYFEALAEDRGVALAMEGELPPVRGDRLMLRRALSNLLSNGLRHTAPGETLTVQLDLQHGAAEVRVMNPGPDIAQEHLPRLFDRFYRVDPARQHKSEGAGLGLAIVKSVAESHGGSVAVSSASGRTCFILRLPVARTPA
jgi:two-component system heavy metal sensor histidine kinase CusS